MIIAELLVTILVAVFVFLYSQGYLAITSKSAVTFIGSARGNSASFTSCSGFIKRIVRFKGDGIHSFVLDSELCKGDMSVELLDSAKNRVMLLTPVNHNASIAVEKKKKYYLIINFKSATGRYSLRRETGFIN